MAKKLSAKDLEEFRSHLLHAQAVLTGDMSQLHQEAFGGETGNGVETRPADTSDGYYQEFNLELLERDESTLREIHEALERIANGTYGLCEGCGNPIFKERLKAVPHARNCIDCQRQAERSGSW